MNQFVIRSLFIVSFTASLFFGCTRRQSEDEEGGRAATKAVVVVRIAPITAHEADEVITAVGKTDVIRKEKVFSPVSGKVVSLPVLEGSVVNTGDSVAVILTKESQAAIAGAEALRRSAKTERQKAEAEKILQLANSSQSTVVVTAKFRGAVALRSVSEGELVAENTELMTFVDLSTTVFLADVPLSSLPRIRKGLRAEVRFASMAERRFAATVDAVLPQSDPQSQTVKVRLRFREQGTLLESILRTEMAGTARIILGTYQNALFVPTPAVLRNDEENSYSVVVVTPDSLARIVPVTVGSRTDSSVEIQSEILKEGMRVIVEGHYALPDSTKVVVKP